jgi:hypothetical protein
VSVLETFAVGIAPDHWPALVAAAALPAVVAVARRVSTQRRALAAQLGNAVSAPTAPVPLVPRLVAWLLGLSAAVHLALPLGHHDDPLLLVGFLGSGVAYGWLALRAARGKRYTLGTALLILANLVAYLVVLGTGGEEPDQVGIATAMIELLALALCLIPESAAGRRKLGRRIAGSIGFVLVALLFGTVLWVQAFVQHGDTAQVDAASHHHGHAARAQRAW